VAGGGVAGAENQGKMHRIALCWKVPPKPEKRAFQQQAITGELHLMPKKISDFTWGRIRKDYLAGRGTLAQLAKQYGVGERTLKAKASAEGWAAARDVQNEILAGAIAQSAAVAREKNVVRGNASWCNDILLGAIQHLAESLPNTPTKSAEGAAVATARLLESFRKFNPLSIDELIDAALELPDFSAEKFAQRLRERLNRTA